MQSKPINFRRSKGNMHQFFFHFDCFLAVFCSVSTWHFKIKSVIYLTSFLGRVKFAITLQSFWNIIDFRWMCITYRRQFNLASNSFHFYFQFTYFWLFCISINFFCISIIKRTYNNKRNVLTEIQIMCRNFWNSCIFIEENCDQGRRVFECFFFTFRF